ncbi:MAG TPA: PAS domain-containing protein [Kofleriaceae bacterium]|nr:PAS domain-containing protein [Kofleriaceae bacterium]
MASPPDLAQMFELLPNAFMVLDRELRYVAANAAYLAVTGSTREALLGSYVFDSFPDDPDDPNSANAALLRTSFERVLSTGQGDEVAAITYRVQRAPGGPLENRVWTARHTPLLDPAGQVAYIVQETTEITHLQVASSSPAEATLIDRAIRAQVAATSLDAQLRSLRLMFDQAPGFMCFLRGEHHVFEIVNRAYLQLVGHRGVLGMTVAAALPEVVGQGFIDLLDRVFHTGEPFIGHDVPVQLTRTPGGVLEQRYLDFVYQPIRELSGATVGIFVQGQDVTERHEAAQRQRFLIEAIPVQVWTARPDGALDFVSSRVEAYFQRCAADLLGDGWLALIHPDDVDGCTQRWAASIATGQPYEVEFRLRRHDGAYRWHLARANPDRDANGTILRWFGTNTDVHDAKLALAEVQSRAEYEQRLIGIVSHDLRNPLNAISLAATLLAAQPLAPLAAKTVTRLQRSADRATRLIADLLDFAKARIGSSIPINPRPTNLREIIEQVVDEFQVVAPSRIIRVGHAGDERGTWDADRIAQVIANLVGNAIQHGTATQPITVESRIEGDDAMLAVWNDGPAIPDAELAELFEPFKRGRNAGAARGSMGLGLYIAREVVSAHGGSISVASQGGRGTCITVRLPRFTPTAGSSAT